MRSQFRRDAIPYVGIQPPAVQQHKMTISFARGLPPNVIHQLLFSFHHYEGNYANSTQLMLAMPNAAGHGSLGDVLALHRLAARHAIALPAVRFYRHWRPPCPCGRCLQKPPPRQRLVTVNSYAPPLSGLVHQFKFARHPELAAALARLLLLRLRLNCGLPSVDRIVSVPLWQRRHWRRGFNQSEALCRPLARWMGCARRGDALTRSRRTATQHQLSARLRKQNLKKMLSVLNYPFGASISPLWMMSSQPEAPSPRFPACFLRNGAATVQVWCLCRTL